MQPFLNEYMTVKRKVKFEGVPYEGNLEELIIQALIEKQGVETLCDFVQEQTKRVANVKPLNVEGLENKEWVLLDYFNILVHIFQPEAREYYQLESLWGDADIQKF